MTVGRHHIDIKYITCNYTKVFRLSLEFAKKGKTLIWQGKNRSTRNEASRNKEMSGVVPDNASSYWDDSSSKDEPNDEIII